MSGSCKNIFKSQPDPQWRRFQTTSGILQWATIGQWLQRLSVPNIHKS